MPSPAPSSDPQTAGDLVALVDASRIRLRTHRLMLAGACGIAAIVGFLLLAGFTDILLPLSIPLRVAAFIALLAVTAAALIGVIGWGWLRSPDEAGIARRIERLIPHMHNRLVTVLDLHHRDAAALRSAFGDDLLRQTRARLSPLKPHHLTDAASLGRACFAAAAAIVLAIAAIVALPARMPTALARLLAPTADIAPVTGIVLRAEPGDLDALQGDPVTLAARVERGNADALDILLRDADAADAPWHRHRMTPAGDGRFTFALTAVDRTYEYRVEGGRTWTPAYRVTMVRRPVIEALAMRVRLPAYMGINQPLPAGDGALTAPLGAEIEVQATVRGEASLGRLKLTHLIATAGETESDLETAWFDDELPRDAELIGDWHWRSEAASGSRSHTFGGTRRAYGFRSRLSPLTIAADAAFFMDVRLDRDAPPKRLAVTLGDDRSRIELVWGEPAERSAAPQPPALRTVHAGALPAASGRWTRLEVPASAIIGDPSVTSADNGAGNKPGERATSASFTSITFAIDGGRVLLDRAGVVTHRRSAITTTRSDVDRQLTMVQAEPGVWTGRFTVERDTHVTAEMVSARGHASRALTPLKVTASTDAPPWMVVEKPGRAVTLSVVQAIPIAVRAFDDYGLEAVGIQSASELLGLDTAPIRWMQTWSEPATTRLAIGMIEPVDEHGNAPRLGDALFCRAVARDRKGQLAHGEPIRIAYQTDPATPAPPANAAAELARLQQVLEALAADQRRLSDEVDRALALADPQSRRELDARLAQQRQAAARLARDLDRQANEAERSPLASPLEDDALRMLADQARDVARPPVNKGTDDAAITERLKQWRDASPAQRDRLARMLEQMKSLAKAREQMAGQPGKAQQSFEDLLAQLEAHGAADELDELAAALDQRRRELEELQKRQKELAERAKAAENEKAGIEQRKLDDETIPALEKTDDLLRRPEDDGKSLKPWEPRDPEGEKAAARRDELTKHQDRMASALGAGQGNLSEAREQAMRLAQSVRQSAETNDKSAATTLNTSEMKSMMNMAGRARMQAIEAAQLAQGERGSRRDGPVGGEDQPGSADAPGATPARRGSVSRADGAPDPAGSAVTPGIYRLPPQLRDALLSGMNDQGPRGYQKIIDAYHRQLTEGGK